MLRWRIGHFAAPAALAEIVRRFDPRDQSAAALEKIGAEEPKQTYAAERAIIDNYRVIPLVYLPETFALGPAVRDWMPSRSGAWRIEDV